MKRLIAVAAAIVVSLFAGGMAFAAQSNTLTVSAEVQGSCGFTAGASTMNFGVIDPAVGNGTQSTTIQWWCTKGTAITGFTVNNGLHFSGSRRMLSGTSGDFLPYSLSYTVPVVGTTGNGRSNPTDFVINGTVLATDAGNVTAANDYSDTVTISITP